jgi:hypothetical protein
MKSLPFTRSFGVIRSAVYKVIGMITIGPNNITMVMFPCLTSVTVFRGFIHNKLTQ